MPGGQQRSQIEPNTPGLREFTFDFQQFKSFIVGDHDLAMLLHFFKQLQRDIHVELKLLGPTKCDQDDENLDSTGGQPGSPWWNLPQ